MAYFGKQFKKVRTENAGEFITKLNLSQQILRILSDIDALATFTMNADGSIQYQVKSDGKIVLDQKITLTEKEEAHSHSHSHSHDAGDSSHQGFKTPDGMDTQVQFYLDGDELRSHIHLPNGKVIHMDRHFEANSMKLELYIKNTEEKAIVYYEAVYISGLK